MAKLRKLLFLQAHAGLADDVAQRAERGWTGNRTPERRGGGGGVQEWVPQQPQALLAKQKYQALLERRLCHAHM